MIFLGWMYGLFFFLYNRDVLFGNMILFFFLSDVSVEKLLIVIFVLSYLGKIWEIFMVFVMLLYFFMDMIEICFWLKIFVFFWYMGLCVLVFFVSLKCRLLGNLLYFVWSLFIFLVINCFVFVIYMFFVFVVMCFYIVIIVFFLILFLKNFVL